MITIYPYTAASASASASPNPFSPVTAGRTCWTLESGMEGTSCGIIRKKMYLGRGRWMVEGGRGGAYHAILLFLFVLETKYGPHEISAGGMMCVYYQPTYLLAHFFTHARASGSLS